jgi:hypothetical protein
MALYHGFDAPTGGWKITAEGSAQRVCSSSLSLLTHPWPERGLQPALLLRCAHTHLRHEFLLLLDRAAGCLPLHSILANELLVDLVQRVGQSLVTRVKSSYKHSLRL